MSGVGHYLCSIAVLPFEKDVVTSWLPDVLELAPQDISPPGTHPVNLLFGKERNVHLSFFPWFHIKYMEFAFVVPFVQWKDTSHQYRGPYLFTPLLFLNKLLPILAGKILYGYPKRDAVMSEKRGHYTVVEKGTEIISADFTRTTQTPNQSELDTITALLQQPDLSQSIFGPYIYATFDWNIPSAKIIAETADLDIQAGLLPNQPAIKQTVSGFPTQGQGVYHINTNWTLTLPRIAK